MSSGCVKEGAPASGPPAVAVMPPSPAEVARKLASEKGGNITAAFLEAVNRGDCAVARAFVQTLHVNVNSARDRNDRTALHHAALKGDAAMVKLLAGDFGASPEVRCDDGRTPLLYAALGGHAGIVRDLANTYGANTKARQHDGWTALHLAASKDHAEVTRVLVAELGAIVDERDDSPDKPARNEGEWLANLLLALRCRTPKAATPLHHATAQGSASVARVLIELGADVNALCNFGRTPLHWAARNNSPEVATLLIGGEADINAKQQHEEYTPLHLAAEFGHESVCRALLAAGDRIEINATAANGRTPLHIAAVEGEVGVVRLLAKDGRASATAQCKMGRTPLHWAAFKGKTDVIRVLVRDVNVDVDIAQPNGWTALHLAAANDYSEAVSALIGELGANTTAVDNDGKTAEARARLYGQADVVKLFAARRPTKAEKATKLVRGCSLQ